jgi:cytochrome bd-type quinol oxidase subunit 2
MRTRFAKQAAVSAAVFAVSIGGILWQFSHAQYNVNLFEKHRVLDITLIAVCVVSFWYGCWSFGYAKGYALLGAFLPFLSLFGLALLAFLPDRSMLAPWNKEVRAQLPRAVGDSNLAQGRTDQPTSL